MTDASPPGDDGAICTFGPYTIRCCVTAACTRCGSVPVDEDTGIAPHFDNPGQAAGELAGDWGWRFTAPPGGREHHELLCPACAKADDDDYPRAPGASDGSGPAPGTTPQGEAPAQAPKPPLPANARIPRPPARTRTREGS
jgi:hypothetical protein